MSRAIKAGDFPVRRATEPVPADQAAAIVAPGSHEIAEGEQYRGGVITTYRREMGNIPTLAAGDLGVF